MGNPYEFSPAQNLFGFLREDGPRLFGGKPLWKGYRLPTEPIPDRPLDTATISKLSNTKAFRDELDSSVVEFPKDQSKWKAHWSRMSGQPIQTGDPSQPIEVRVMEQVWVGSGRTNTGNVAYSAQVPGPIGGYLWVQGHPQPVEQALGWSDCHARLLNSDGSSTEMIGARPVYSGKKLRYVECSSLGRYSAEGELLYPQDEHVTVWKESTQQGDLKATRISPLMLDFFERHHRLALVVQGDDKATETMGEIGLWIGLPHSAVPWNDLTPADQRIAQMLVTHGAITMDHGGRSGLVHVSGGQWGGIKFSGWAPKLGEFKVVTA